MFRSFLATNLLVAACWLMPALAVSRASLISHQQIDPSGTYQGDAPRGDAARRVFTLDLEADGSAVFTTLYAGKDDAIQRGRWTQSRGQVELRFDALGSNRPLAPITFRHHDHELSPLHWDTNEWGRKGPPILHRARTKAASRGPARGEL